MHELGDPVGRLLGLGKMLNDWVEHTHLPENVASVRFLCEINATFADNGGDDSR